MAAAVLIGSLPAAYANSVVSNNVNGNWTSPATWVGNVPPTAADNVTIVGGATVTVDTTSCACNSLTINDGTSGNARLVFGAGQKLVVTNVVQLGTATQDGNIDLSAVPGATLQCSGFTQFSAPNFLTGTASTIILTGNNSLPPVLSDTVPIFNLSITGGTTTLVGNLNINGTLSIAPGAALSDPAYNLKIFGNATVNGTITFGASAASTFKSIATIGAAGSFTDSGAGIIHHFENGLTANGALSTSASNTYSFEINNQDFNGTATIPIVALASGKKLVNLGNLTTSNLSGAGPEQFFQGTGATLNIGGPIASIITNFSAVNNTVNYNGSGTQTVIPGNYYNLKISGAANTVVFSAGSIGIAGNFDTSSAVPVLGWSGTGNTITFNGSAPQTILGGPSMVNAGTVVLANPNGVTLAGQDFGVTAALQLTSGNVLTGANNLRLLSTTAVTGASAASHIVGNELVYFNAGAGQSFTFDVGDASLLARVSISNFLVNTAGSLTVSTTAGNEPHVASSGLDPSATAARFWTLSTPDGLAGTFDTVFNFNTADAGTANPNNFLVKRFNTSWFAVTTGARTSVSTQATGVNSAALGNFQLGEAALPPVFNSSGIVVSGDPVTGMTLSFSAVASDPNGLPLSYNWDFGDGTIVSSGSSASIQHVYSSGGTFTVTLTVTNSFASNLLSLPLTIIAPAPGAEGIENIGQNDDPVANVFNGIAIDLKFSNGGVIGLKVDVDALNRAAFNISTAYAGTAGNMGTRSGVTPIYQFMQPGVFVATAAAADAATSSVAGKARKTLAVGNREVGLAVKYKTDPRSPKVKTGKIAGKFSFPRSNAAAIGKFDIVTYSGTFELPEGLDLSSQSTFSFSIGNVVDEIAIDAKGRGSGKSATGMFKKVQMKYPKLAKGAKLTAAGQTATFQVSISGKDLSSQGFDTEGIVNSVLESEKALKSVPRSIQVAMVFAGAAYSSMANVNFKLAGNNAGGSIGTRTGP
jgi:hypothetical protein